MINGLNNLPLGRLSGPGASPVPVTPPPTGASFADVLKQQIGEVAQMQQDASKAVQDVSLGNTNDLDSVFVAMEKSETAFKTLVAIRSKLMEAYDEIKNMPI